MRARIQVCLVAAAATTIAGCGPGSSPRIDPGPDAAPAAEDDRPADVYVPAGVGPGTPAPLVLHLLGTGFEPPDYLDFTRQADERGFLYARAQATRGRDDVLLWDATDACCRFGDGSVDDAGYLRGVIEDIRGAFAVDPARIYVVGHSTGGFMAHRMACDHADVVAAIASLSGVTFADEARCAASEPVSVLQVHGRVDLQVLFGGGTLEGVAYPGAVETVETWAALDGCEGTPVAGEPVDVDGEFDGPETEVTRYESGCAPGGHAELWAIAGGVHAPTLSPAFAPAVIDFLLAHPKPL